MYLLDHLHNPVKRAIQWNSFHSHWLSGLSADLNRRLPPNYYADPGVKLGIEVDVGAVEWLTDGAGEPLRWQPDWAAPAATATLPFTLATDELEVLVYGDTNDGHRLVGAVGLVSPANKDRAATRQQFVTKCLDYLAHGVGVVLVDAVTTEHVNLHNELMDRVDHPADRLPGHLYATAYRPTGKNGDGRLDLWLYPLAVGEPLPTVPLWLYGGLCVPAELGATYAEVCVKARLAERLGLLDRAAGGSPASSGGW
jgi:hypothetical protein